MAVKTSRARKQRTSIEEVVHYALAHKIRVHILVLLQDRERTTAQIAAILDEQTNTVANHMRYLLEDGAIEIAKEEQAGNVIKYWYRGVTIPFISHAEAEDMVEGHRHTVAGLVVQAALAEVLVALWAGNLADPQTNLYVNWHALDQQGREDLEVASEEYFERVKEIEDESSSRSTASSEDLVSMQVTLFNYERARVAEE